MKKTILISSTRGARFQRVGHAASCRVPLLALLIISASAFGQTPVATLKVNPNTGAVVDQANFWTSNAAGICSGINATVAPAWSNITSKPTTLSGYGITDAAVAARTISTTAPLSGGGDLSANRTLSIAEASASASGVITTGSQSIAGAKEFLGDVTAPNVSAPAATEVISRIFSDQLPIWDIELVQRIGPPQAVANSGTGSFASALGGTGIGSFRTGTGTGGYGFAYYGNAINYGAGSGVATLFNVPFSVAIFGRCNQPGSTTTGIARFVIAHAAAAPQTADADGLTSIGWGIEIGPSDAGGGRQIRVIYHDGTTFGSTGWVNLISGPTTDWFTLVLENAGGGVMRVYSRETSDGGNQNRRPAYTPIISTTGGPTGNASYLTGLYFCVVNPSSGSVPLSTYAELCSVILLRGALEK